MKDIEALGEIVKLLEPLHNSEKIRIVAWLEYLRDSDWYDGPDIEPPKKEKK